jgi:SAM-dependent methyltransferase
MELSGAKPDPHDTAACSLPLCTLSLPLMPQPSSRDRFFNALNDALRDDALEKLALGKYRGPDASLKKLTIRAIVLKTGAHLSFVWRHKTQDITKNLPVPAALKELDRLIGTEFRDAHLFTAQQTAQLETKDDGSTRVRFKATASTAPVAKPIVHDRIKPRLIDPRAGWLRNLDVTNDQGQPRAGQSSKFRQIQKFGEILQHHIAEAGLATTGTSADAPSCRIADMGCGKGYLTFATADLLGSRTEVVGLERRKDLVDTCNRVAQKHEFEQLNFRVGDITDVAKELGNLDVLIALHACDTATDDALAAGIAAGAKLLVVAPCCQKELRAQLKAPAVLGPALRHGIFQERHAEFVTDALRALLLEAVGFETKAFEFISHEHTAKNLMLTATRTSEPNQSPIPAAVDRARAFAQFYGIREHALAGHLSINLN